LASYDLEKRFLIAPLGCRTHCRLKNSELPFSPNWNDQGDALPAFLENLEELLQAWDLRQARRSYFTGHQLEGNEGIMQTQ
jgi:hypothetical protein